MNHGFIGFGNVARAVYHGLKDENDLVFRYYCRSPKHTEVASAGTLAALVQASDVLWLAVKPQDLEALLVQLQPLDRRDKVFVSPVAAKPIAFIERYLGPGQTIVRIMPNLAIAYKKSVTAFATNQPNNPATESIFQLLAKLGRVVSIDESAFDLFTSVFGSGPAFILLFIKIFKDKIQEFDLPGPLLDSLLLELAEGTVSYFAENQKNIA